VRRLFWFTAGAAAGYYVARRGERVVAEARERGVVGNVTLAAGAASRLAQNAAHAAAGLAERTQATGPVDPTPLSEGRP
jgi:hypothetical protein